LHHIFRRRCIAQSFHNESPKRCFMPLEQSVKRRNISLCIALHQGKVGGFGRVAHTIIIEALS
jgi:hypothetical protein